MPFDLSQFFIIRRPQITSLGKAGDIITVMNGVTNLPFGIYFGGYHPRNPRHWKKRFADDLAKVNGKF